MRSFKGKLFFDWQMIVINFLVFASFSGSLSNDYEYSSVRNTTKRKMIFTNNKTYLSYETRKILSLKVIYLMCCHLFTGSVQQDAMKIFCV